MIHLLKLFLCPTSLWQPPVYFFFNCLYKCSYPGMSAPSPSHFLSLPVFFCLSVFSMFQRPTIHLRQQQRLSMLTLSLCLRCSKPRNFSCLSRCARHLTSRLRVAQVSVLIPGMKARAKAFFLGSGGLFYTTHSDSTESLHTLESLQFSGSSLFPRDS